MTSGGQGWRAGQLSVFGSVFRSTCRILRKSGERIWRVERDRSAGGGGCKSECGEAGMGAGLDVGVGASGCRRVGAGQDL